ncbi:MAG TPA: alpha/beta hydrolase [Nitrospirota bacterium]|nr:alpha/beta hydrolase [Nitrospirota bacterium]
MNRANNELFLGVMGLLLLFAPAACLPPTTVPIDAIRYPGSTAPAATMLLVFLPGRGDDMTVFKDKGLVDAVRTRGLDADMIAVNAHLGYYLEGTVFTRIKKDIIEPAKARGYHRIWLVGNSLGGYGSVSYARQFPEDIEGVVLLGPFLGKDEVIDEIKSAGGISKWHPSEIRKKTEDEWDKQLWLWIKDNIEQEKFRRTDCDRGKACAPRVYLGYGSSDRFSGEQAYLASLLPPSHVKTIRGGHDWRTWGKLWSMFLDAGIFRNDRQTGLPVREVKE